MARINIDACGRLSNLDAIEAVAGWIKATSGDAGYKATREVGRYRGMRTKVTEIPYKDEDSIVSCHFKVETVCHE